MKNLFVRKKVLFVIIIFTCLTFIVSVFLLLRNLNKTQFSNINCPQTSLIKTEDVEGNTFIFEDTPENSNLKTNFITFNEEKLGIKSLAAVKDSDPKINYISKNESITYSEITNLQSCYKDSTIVVSNNYNFNTAFSNKYCNVVIKDNLTYELVDCK
jgi:hypothetical protein